MAEDEDVVEIRFNSSSGSGEPPRSGVQPTPPPPPIPDGPDGDRIIDFINEELNEAANDLADSADSLEQAAKSFEAEADKDNIASLDNVSWVSLAQAVDNLLRQSENESGQGLDSIDAAARSLGNQLDSRMVIDLPDAINSLARNIDSLETAIKGFKGSSGPREPRTPKPDKKAELSFFDRLNKYVTRPSIQAAYTPTLFRNNLERGALSGLAKLAQSGPSIARGASSLAGLTGLGAGAVSAASALGTLAGAALAVPAVLLGLATAAVGVSQAFDAANQKIANSIIDVSPEVAIAQSQRDLADFNNSRIRAMTIGPDVASAMLEFQDITDQLSRLVTNVFDWVDNAATRWGLDRIEELLVMFNNLLESADGVDNSLKQITRSYLKTLNEEFAKLAKDEGLDQFAIRLAAQSGDSALKILAEQARRNATEGRIEGGFAIPGTGLPPGFGF